MFMNLKYEPETGTIRSVPENYWVASCNSWDGAVDNDEVGTELVKRYNEYEGLATLLRLIDEVFDSCPDHLDVRDMIALRGERPHSIRNLVKMMLERVDAYETQGT